MSQFPPAIQTPEQLLALKIVASASPDPEMLKLYNEYHQLFVASPEVAPALEQADPQLVADLSPFPEASPGTTYNHRSLTGANPVDLDGVGAFLAEQAMDEERGRMSFGAEAASARSQETWPERSRASSPLPETLVFKDVPTGRTASLADGQWPLFLIENRGGVAAPMAQPPIPYLMAVGSFDPGAMTPDEVLDQSLAYAARELVSVDPSQLHPFELKVRQLIEGRELGSYQHGGALVDIREVDPDLADRIVEANDYQTTSWASGFWSWIRDHVGYSVNRQILSIPNPSPAWPPRGAMGPVGAPMTQSFQTPEKRELDDETARAAAGKDLHVRTPAITDGLLANYRVLLRHESRNGRIKESEEEIAAMPDSSLRRELERQQREFHGWKAAGGHDLFNSLVEALAVGMATAPAAAAATEGTMGLRLLSGLASRSAKAAWLTRAAVGEAYEGAAWMMADKALNPERYRDAIDAAGGFFVGMAMGLPARAAGPAARAVGYSWHRRAIVNGVDRLTALPMAEKRALVDGLMANGWKDTFVWEGRAAGRRQASRAVTGAAVRFSEATGMAVDAVLSPKVKVRPPLEVDPELVGARMRVVTESPGLEAGDPLPRVPRVRRRDPGRRGRPERGDPQGPRDPREPAGPVPEARARRRPGAVSIGGGGKPSKRVKSVGLAKAARKIKGTRFGAIVNERAHAAYKVLTGTGFDEEIARIRDVAKTSPLKARFDVRKVARDVNDAVHGLKEDLRIAEEASKADVARLEAEIDVLVTPRSGSSPSARQKMLTAGRRWIENHPDLEDVRRTLDLHEALRGDVPSGKIEEAVEAAKALAALREANTRLGIANRASASGEAAATRQALTENLIPEATKKYDAALAAIGVSREEAEKIAVKTLRAMRAGDKAWEKRAIRYHESRASVDGTPAAVAARNEAIPKAREILESRLDLSLKRELVDARAATMIAEARDAMGDVFARARAAREGLILDVADLRAHVAKTIDDRVDDVVAGARSAESDRLMDEFRKAAGNRTATSIRRMLDSGAHAEAAKRELSAVTKAAHRFRKAVSEAGGFGGQPGVVSVSGLVRRATGVEIGSFNSLSPRQARTLAEALDSMVRPLRVKASRGLNRAKAMLFSDVQGTLDALGIDRAVFKDLPARDDPGYPAASSARREAVKAVQGWIDDQLAAAGVTPGRVKAEQFLTADALEDQLLLSEFRTSGEAGRAVIVNDPAQSKRLFSRLEPLFEESYVAGFGGDHQALLRDVAAKGEWRAQSLSFRDSVRDLMPWAAHGSRRARRWWANLSTRMMEHPLGSSAYHQLEYVDAVAGAYGLDSFTFREAAMKARVSTHRLMTSLAEIAVPVVEETAAMEKALWDMSRKAGTSSRSNANFVTSLRQLTGLRINLDWWRSIDPESAMFDDAVRLAEKAEQKIASTLKELDVTASQLDDLTQPWRKFYRDVYPIVRDEALALGLKPPKEIHEGYFPMREVGGAEGGQWRQFGSYARSMFVEADAPFLRRRSSAGIGAIDFDVMNAANRYVRGAVLKFSMGEMVSSANALTLAAETLLPARTAQSLTAAVHNMVDSYLGIPPSGGLKSRRVRAVVNAAQSLDMLRLVRTATIFQNSTEAAGSLSPNVGLLEGLQAVPRSWWVSLQKLVGSEGTWGRHAEALKRWGVSPDDDHFILTRMDRLGGDLLDDAKKTASRELHSKLMSPYQTFDIGPRIAGQEVAYRLVDEAPKDMGWEVFARRSRIGVHSGAVNAGTRGRLKTLFEAGEFEQLKEVYGVSLSVRSFVDYGIGGRGSFWRGGTAKALSPYMSYVTGRVQAAHEILADYQSATTRAGRVEAIGRMARMAGADLSAAVLAGATNTAPLWGTTPAFFQLGESIASWLGALTGDREIGGAPSISPTLSAGVDFAAALGKTAWGTALLASDLSKDALEAMALAAAPDGSTLGLGRDGMVALLERLRNNESTAEHLTVAREYARSLGAAHDEFIGAGRRLNAVAYEAWRTYGLFNDLVILADLMDNEMQRNDDVENRAVAALLTGAMTGWRLMFGYRLPKDPVADMQLRLTAARNLAGGLGVTAGAAFQTPFDALAAGWESGERRSTGYAGSKALHHPLGGSAYDLKDRIMRTLDDVRGRIPDAPPDPDGPVFTPSSEMGDDE